MRNTKTKAFWGQEEEELTPDSGENAGETGAPNSGSAAFAPFEAWSEWLRDNMGATSATPGPTGEGEAEAVPEGAAARATASDPLMSGARDDLRKIVRLGPNIL